MTVRELAERGKIYPRLRRAARTLRLRDYIVAPGIGEPPTAADLWKQRHADFKTGKEIGFSFARERAAHPVLRGTARKLADGRACLVLAGPPDLTEAYTKELGRAGATVERSETEGVTLKQRWTEASGEIVADRRTHGGRAPLRRPDFWAFLEHDLWYENTIPPGRRLIDVEGRRRLLAAVLYELARLRGKARKREVARERAMRVRKARDTLRSSLDFQGEDMDADARRFLERRIDAIRAAHPTPTLADEIAAALREWGAYDRLEQELLGKAGSHHGRRSWPGLRKTMSRLRAGYSVNDLHAIILHLHQKLTP